MKTIGDCIFCHEIVYYEAVYKQQSDHNYFGGDICPLCNQKGLGFFLAVKKRKLEKQLRNDINMAAHAINNQKSKKGTWWKKDSELFTTLAEMLDITKED